MIDKQRKRRRRSGAQYNSEGLDLLVGDIHHRPIIVLSFIAVTTFAACWAAWLNGQLNSGLMLMVSLFALALTWVSRQRAKVHHLRLPDINGIEMPFFVTMGSLSLIYLVGHFGPLGSKFNQLDLLVLTFGLVGLSLISLYGREDLPWRIPSAVEGIVMMLLISRLAGAMMLNAVPFPFTVDLLDDSHGFIDWQLPWLFHEITLLALVLIWEWIEGFRRSHEMPDHRGAAGRGSFALMVVLISAGPAGVLAGLLCMRRSFDWKQPAAVALSVHAILGGLFAFMAWTDGDDFRIAMQWLFSRPVCSCYWLKFTPSSQRCPSGPLHGCGTLTFSSQSAFSQSPVGRLGWLSVCWPYLWPHGSAASSNFAEACASWVL